MSSAPFRFAMKVDIQPESECWLWTAQCTYNGYGVFYPLTSVRFMPAHRYSYTLFVGPIPEGMQIDHLCRVRSCVNPDHLEPVTPLENSRRGLKGVLLTECKNGHPLEGSNIYQTDIKRRGCRECARRWNREYRARKKARSEMARVA